MSAEHGNEPGIEMSAGAAGGDLACGLDAAAAMMDLDHVSKRHDPDREWQTLAPDVIGDALPSHRS